MAANNLKRDTAVKRLTQALGSRIIEPRTAYLGDGEGNVVASADTGVPNTVYIRFDLENPEFQVALVDPLANTALYYENMAVVVTPYHKSVAGKIQWYVSGSDVAIVSQQLSGVSGNAYGGDGALGFGGLVRVHNHEDAANGGLLDISNAVGSGVLALEYGGTNNNLAGMLSGALVAKGGSELAEAFFPINGILVGDDTGAPQSLLPSNAGDTVRSLDGTTWVSAPPPIRSITGDETLAVGDYTVLVDTSLGDVTVTLPDPASCAGREYVIKRITGGGNTLTVDGNGGDIDGSATISLHGLFDYQRVIGDGTDWWLI
jgi:hypothetical protein